MPSQKDYSKYIFNGELLGKGRMVLAVIKKYVSDHPDVTYKALKKVFPDSLQAESEIQFTETQVVFSKLDDIKPGEEKRFFKKKDEIINLKGCTLAVSREWNHINIQNFLNAADSLAFNIDQA